MAGGGAFPANRCAVHSPPQILVVEDEKVQRMLVRHRLEEAGYLVEEAVDGHEALDVILDARPDLVLLDCVLPGLDGFEILQRLRGDAELRRIPVLMITTLHDPGAKLKALEVGADDFLVKPVEEAELMARVRSLLRLKSLNDELEVRNDLLRRILTRYLAEDLVQRILDDPTEKSLQIGGRLCRVSVLFADIRGFTAFSETRRPEVVAEALNTIFDALVPPIFENRGTFDKYLGDAVLAFYGAPNTYPDDALRAVRTAMQMQDSFNRLLRSRADLKPLGLGIAIVTGDAVVGNLGSQMVMDYTVIGDTSNVCKRVQEHSRGGQVLICPATCRLVDRHVDVRALEPLRLKNRIEPMQVYEVVRFLP